MNEALGRGRTGLLRERSEENSRVTPMELFFDLVYVFAITQLSHLLLEHLDIHGVLQTALLMCAVWIAWIYTTWFTNWFDPNARPVRIVLVSVMVCSLIMSATLPDAFGDRFKRAVFGVWSMQRLAAVVMLAIVAIIARDGPPLMLAVAALLVVVSVSWWDYRTVHVVESEGGRRESVTG